MQCDIQCGTVALTPNPLKASSAAVTAPRKDPACGELQSESFYIMYIFPRHSRVISLNYACGLILQSPQTIFFSSNVFFIHYPLILQNSMGVRQCLLPTKPYPQYTPKPCLNRQNKNCCISSTTLPPSRMA